MGPDDRIQTVEDYSVRAAESFFEQLSLGRVGARAVSHLIRLPQRELFSACREGMRNALVALRDTAKGSKSAVGVLAFHPVLFHQTQQTFVCPYLAEDVKLACADLGFQPDTVVSVHDDLYDMHVRLLGPRQLFDPKTTKRRSGRKESDPQRRSPLADIQEQLHLLGWRSAEFAFAKNFASGLRARHFLFHAKGHLQSIQRIALGGETGVYLSHPIAQPRRDMTAVSEPGKSDSPNYARGKQLQDDIQAVALSLRKAVPLVEPTAIDELRFDERWLANKTDADLKTGILPPLTPRWPIADGDHLLPREKDSEQYPLVDAPPQAFDKMDYSGDSLEPLGVGLTLLKEEISRQVTARDFVLAEQCDLIVAYRPFTKPDSPKPSGGVEKEIEVVLRKVAARVRMCKPALIVYHPQDDERNRRKLEFNAAWPTVIAAITDISASDSQTLHDHILGAFVELPYAPSDEDLGRLHTKIANLLAHSRATVKAISDTSTMAGADQAQRVDATEQLLVDLIDRWTIARSKLHHMVGRRPEIAEYVCFVDKFSPEDAVRLVKKSHDTHSKYVGEKIHAS